MSSKMDGIIDKVADAGEKIADKFDHSDDKQENAEAATGSHRGEAAEEHKHGIMDKIADATEKLVEKFDHSDDAPTSSGSAGTTSSGSAGTGAVTSTPPVEVPGPALGSDGLETNAHMDPTGKVV